MTLNHSLSEVSGSGDLGSGRSPRDGMAKDLDYYLEVSEFEL